MAEIEIDLSNWAGADQFRLFRSYGKPHYAVTSRLDVTNLVIEKKPLGISPYRACLFAIGTGLHSVPELRMRFRGEQIFLHDKIDMSMTVPAQNGSYNYGYVSYFPEFGDFDRAAEGAISAAAAGGLAPNTGERDDLAYLSCMPWLDYSSMNNAMPGPDDCIPRVSWGKFVQNADDQWSMAMTLEVHHALVEGRLVGAYFEHVQRKLDTL